MYIIEVIPIVTLPSGVPQLLSYFHSAELQKGAMVEILIGRRKVKAIAVSCSSLEEQKGLIKKSFFQLKKISNVLSEEPKVSKAQFKILLWLSRRYYTPLGLSLKTVLPNFLLNKKYSIQDAERVEKNTKPKLIVTRSDDLGVQLLNLIDRAKDQVLIIVPDRVTLNHFQSTLTKYNPITIHSGQTDSQKFKNWKLIQDRTKLIIGTRLALFFSFKNLEAIVVEDHLNEMYKSDMTPKYNTPDLAEKVAQTYGAQLHFVSSFVGIINYHKAGNNLIDIDELTPRSSPKIGIINTVNELRAGNFNLLSRELRDQLLSNVERNKKVLIFSPRKGYMGLLLCQNCGTAVKCSSCSVPMRVHKSVELILICHRCSNMRNFPKLCSNCNSCKLKTAGPSGSQKIYDEIRELVSEHGLKPKLMILDSDVVRNETEIEEVINEIKKPGPAILIASQMVFGHRYDISFSIIGVLNADALSAIPDFDIDERFIYHIAKLKDFNPKKLLIQTYSSDNPIYKTVSSENYIDFYNTELETRKLFNYPPFCRLVKLTYRHIDPKRASITARTLVEKLRMVIGQEKLANKASIMDASSAYVAREKGYYIYNVILKLAPILDNPKDILKYVPADWSIELDPKTIL